MLCIWRRCVVHSRTFSCRHHLPLPSVVAPRSVRAQPGRAEEEGDVYTKNVSECTKRRLVRNLPLARWRHRDRPTYGNLVTTSPSSHARGRSGRPLPPPSLVVVPPPPAPHALGHCARNRVNEGRQRVNEGPHRVNERPHRVNEWPVRGGKLHPLLMQVGEVVDHFSPLFGRCTPPPRPLTRSVIARATRAGGRGR